MRLYSILQDFKTTSLKKTAAGVSNGCCQVRHQYHGQVDPGNLSGVAVNCLARPASCDVLFYLAGRYSCGSGLWLTGIPAFTIKKKPEIQIKQLKVVI